MVSEARVLVFDPSPVLTVAIESLGGNDDIHVHAGGQGAWIARMLSALEAAPTLCCPLGGETGEVFRVLAADRRTTLRAVDVVAPTAAYVHDRRSGERTELAEMASPALSRHELDELYTEVLATSFEQPVAVLAGARGDVLPTDTYRRLASDLSSTGTLVVADLTGGQLEAALAGGLDVLKVSHEELADTGWLDEETEESVLAVLPRLAGAGARHVVVSRADDPALAYLDGVAVRVVVPRLDEVDHRGAGDSMTAGIAAALARGLSVEDGVRVGAAAGALNVTRHGLASGNRVAIDRLAERVQLEPTGADASAHPAATPDELAANARPRR